ncbi:MAG: hypothetical protein NTZ68_03565 [Candidatus Dependentiae bacterium]|nr:hypothetical protein [Candidatus Dependentiae bacterium]
MNKSYLLMVVIGFSVINSFGSESTDLLDDYLAFSPVESKEKTMYPIPSIPQQENLFDTGQTCKKTLREATASVASSFCEFVREVADHKDGEVLNIARSFGQNITTSLAPLVDIKTMQGDTGMSVADLIQAGKLSAAISHFEVAKKTDVSLGLSYEQKAHKEVERILMELRQHDDLIQRALCDIYAKKIQKNKELLGDLFLILKALDAEMFQRGKNKNSETCSWCELLTDAQKVLTTMYQSNIISTDRARQEDISFNTIAREIGLKLLKLEEKMKQHSHDLSATVKALERAVGQ